MVLYLKYCCCSLLGRLAPLQRLPHRVHQGRHAIRLVHDHLHAHPPQLRRRRLGHPARHHDHFGVQPAPGLEQPLDHLRRVQVGQRVVEHDHRRLRPPDLEQPVHPARRLHHLHRQIGLRDRQHQRPPVARIVLHHHHHLAPGAALQLQRHPHAVRPQERREVVRLHTAPPRRGLMPLQEPLVDPVRYRRRRYLAHPRDALRAPVALRPSRTHRTPSTTRTGNAQGGLPHDGITLGVLALSNCSISCYRRASTQRLVASRIASTALRSALSRISHVPVSSCASLPPNPWTATSTKLRSNASTSWAPSSAMELSGRRSSRQPAAARAAASTRFRTVSVPCSSASACLSSNDSRTRTTTRCARSAGRTSSPWNTTTRWLARVRTASSCNRSIGRTSAVWATLILRWSIFMPSCAISADSTLRTTCLGCMSLSVSTWISLTSPSGVTTTRADSTPVSPAMRFSARFTPHGSGASTDPWRSEEHTS